MIGKIYYILFLCFLTSNQANSGINISNGEKSQCSTSIGKIDMVVNYISNSENNINSYFLLNFLDKNNKKRTSICRITSIDGSPKSTDSTQQPQISVEDITYSIKPEETTIPRPIDTTHPIKS